MWEKPLYKLKQYFLQEIWETQRMMYVTKKLVKRTFLTHQVQNQYDKMKCHSISTIFGTITWKDIPTPYNWGTVY